MGYLIYRPARYRCVGGRALRRWPCLGQEVLRHGGAVVLAGAGPWWVLVGVKLRGPIPAH